MSTPEGTPSSFLAHLPRATTWLLWSCMRLWFPVTHSAVRRRGAGLEYISSRLEPVAPRNFLACKGILSRTHAWVLPIYLVGILGAEMCRLLSWKQEEKIQMLSFEKWPTSHPTSFGWMLINTFLKNQTPSMVVAIYDFIACSQRLLIAHAVL